MQDVLIVGGSLAGAATAIHLARRGRSVLLVDRTGFPRRKPCGEGLFPRGIAELASLGLDITTIGRRLSTLRFVMDGHVADASIAGKDAPTLGVDRAVLDALLLDAARNAGVEVRTGVEARRLLPRDNTYAVEVDGVPLTPRLIVAADGARSGLRQQAGLDSPSRGRRYGVSAHLSLATEPPPRIDVYFQPGYEVYITPVGGRIVNAAVLMQRPRMQGLAGDLTAGYLDLVRTAGALAPGFELVDEPLATGPFPASATRLWSRNLVLAGDAAGFCDPINGEGMTLALLSARACAAAVDAFLSTGSAQPFRGYERHRRALARTSTLFARLMLALADRPTLGQRAIDNLARHPEVFSKLAAINAGDHRLTDLRPRDLLALLLGR